MSAEFDKSHVDLRSLFETSKILNASLKLDTILNNLLLTPMGRMMISRGLVMVTNDSDLFTIMAVKGLPQTLLRKNFHIEFNFESPILLQNIDPEKCSLKNLFFENGLELFIPIHSSQKMVGLIGLGKKITGNDYSGSELEFLNFLSNLASTAIENALIFQKLENVNRRLDKKILELNSLFDISKELNSTLDRNKIINLLIYAVMGEMLAHKCYVFTKTNNNLKLFKPRINSAGKEDTGLFIDKKFLFHLGEIKEPMLVDNTVLSHELLPLRTANIKIVVPMRNQDFTNGILLIGDRINKKSYDINDIEFLSTLCNQAMISLENARLFDETIEKQRMEKELNIAREIQQRLLPESFPVYDSFQLHGVNIPSREVGGDYFDCIRLDENRFALAIGDVSGKGAPASLLMSNLHAGLHTLIMTKADILSIMPKLNNLIHAHTNFDKFITFFYGEIDIKNKTFTYSNAGHNPPYLYHKDGSFETLDNGGLLLGMMPNAAYETGTVQLHEGDLLLMFTDGVTEAMNRLDEEFDDWRVQKILEDAIRNNYPIEKIIKIVIKKVNEFSQGLPQSDDITLLGLRVIE